MPHFDFPHENGQDSRKCSTDRLEQLTYTSWKNPKELVLKFFHASDWDLGPDCDGPAPLDGKQDAIISALKERGYHVTEYDDARGFHMGNIATFSIPVGADSAQIRKDVSECCDKHGGKYTGLSLEEKSLKHEKRRRQHYEKKAGDFVAEAMKIEQVDLGRTLSLEGQAALQKKFKRMMLQR